MDGEKVEATEEEAPDELEPLLRQLCEAVAFNRSGRIRMLFRYTGR
jgi:hypothetical protein